MQVLNESSGFLMELIHLLLLDIITYQSLASLYLSTLCVTCSSIGTIQKHFNMLTYNCITTKIFYKLQLLS